MVEKIGFIGLGIMGKPMALNLLKAGYPVLVQNHRQAVTDEMSAHGAQAAPSPAEVAAQSDIVITMLPDSPQVRDVMLGEQGVIMGAHTGLIAIDMSTISPIVTREIAQRLSEQGVEMLDAPVSGGDRGAIEGTLSIMVGGSEATFSRCRPIFEALGKTIVHVGEIGAGQIVKACNQIVVALTIEAVGEALVLGSRAGVRPEKILQVLGGGLAANRVMELRGPNMLAHNFTPGFRIRLHHKDLGIALSTARAFGTSLPVTALIDQMLAALEANGRGELDHSALLTYLEDLAQHRIGENEE
ncbi:2-hydroxy-3-oxopropionate reductase [Thermosporothrix hazakensis]|jgi:2-hydroxy-3-oxopropionate reductase|uniref:2-hydroxy-3-oxopropionate reductase n=2 Tax=Thermosporothrix TaxID=768650 RepID=A0A326UFD5_THEHA|nr:2-hydroxy-3-oxopropionate reductase [Thermosporothrix hazakensis]PZW29323.1 2-hydroxy-3-oxopropionate reductase [Thermosporothrix hazakensis]BBH86252.1 2-hydroxy-3-oxopropionate reductase [Thermosporothrix sp. COM3]GCE45326.1 2-hydroxy-3-oxopropionate reductase [Thermosporothrix hazakensis]